MDSVQRFETEAAANAYIDSDNIQGWDAEAVELEGENHETYWAIECRYPGSTSAYPRYLRESGYVS